MAVLHALAALSFAFAASAQSETESAAPGAEAFTTLEARRLAACNALATAPWPANRAERVALLQRMEGVRLRCMDHAGFLAALGGSWLEEGNPMQALLWLERALLLDPDHLAARADHALALAATGEGLALADLRREWRLRQDVPALLKQRLEDADRQLHAELQRTAARGPDRAWAQSRELSAFVGYESNLDRSPRLAELEITPPDGPITLPLDKPLVPRAGPAVSLDASWQVAYSPALGTVVQAGLQAATRASPGNSDTDWYNVQLAAGASQRFGGWRAGLQASVTSIGGNLNERYQLTRFSVSAESNGYGCMHRLAADFETRRQAVTSLGDSRSVGGTWSSQCPLPALSGWTGALALRVGTDEPYDPERAGGIQRQATVGLRLVGPVGALGRLESGLRITRTLDSEIYSSLFLDKGRRWLVPIQLNAEYAHPASSLGLSVGEAVLQIQAIRQSSNLPLFRYSSVSVFTGLRVKW